jgi:hypothetical protein
VNRDVEANRSILADSSLPPKERTILDQNILAALSLAISMKKLAPTGKLKRICEAIWSTSIPLIAIALM